MAQQIQPSQPSTRSLTLQRATESKMALAGQTTPQEAAKQGKRLIGCFPHARPPDPESYALAIATVLQQFPPAVVAECCDPRYGLPRTREFPPTVASIVDWCELRVKRHTGAIIHGRMEQDTMAEQAKFTPEHRLTMLERLKGLMRGLLVREREESKA